MEITGVNLLPTICDKFRQDKFRFFDMVTKVNDCESNFSEVLARTRGEAVSLTIIKRNLVPSMFELLLGKSNKL